MNIENISIFYLKVEYFSKYILISLHLSKLFPSEARILPAYLLQATILNHYKNKAIRQRS